MQKEPKIKTGTAHRHLNIVLTTLFDDPCQIRDMACFNPMVGIRDQPQLIAIVLQVKLFLEFKQSCQNILRRRISIFGRQDLELNPSRVKEIKILLNRVRVFRSNYDKVRTSQGSFGTRQRAFSAQGLPQGCDLRMSLSFSM